MVTATDVSYSHNTPCVVALGCFDGVHIGHAAVINAAVKKAHELSLPSCVWSFAEPPKRFYAPDSVSLLTDSISKNEIISSFGVDIYLSVRFNESIAEITPEDFFETFLIKNLNAQCIVCGYDFTFGKGGKGNTESLKKLCEEHDVIFMTVSPVDIDGVAVSSSVIRELLLNGNVDKASCFLGRYYSITSTVVDGKHLGRNLGFPTINQKISKELCVPAYGVYLSRATIDNLCYYGITNIGTQPTVGGHEVVCETNIFDFSGDLYGKRAKIEFLRFIRPEKKFSSVDILTAQVNKDISAAKKLINEIAD